MDSSVFSTIFKFRSLKPFATTTSVSELYLRFNFSVGTNGKS